MPARFHVFLSHSSADKPAVEELAKRLQAEGIEPWLDKWNLIPGDAWQSAIEDALRGSATCAVFIGPGGFGAWHNEELRAAIDRRVRETRAARPGDAKPFRVIPVLLPSAQPPGLTGLPSFLAATTWVEFRTTLDDPTAFHRLVCGIRGIAPGAGPGLAPPEGENPYRGLESFDEPHARFFFGRERLTQELVFKLRPSPSGEERRFLAVLGASGSGKSSLAKAGLVPALRRGEIDGSANWPVTVFKPGHDPLESLAVALAGLDGSEPSAVAVRGLIAGLRAGENTLHLTTRLALRDAPATRRVVLLIDQFEEVFTLCDEVEARKALFANLIYAATITDGRTVVVPTLRADFYGKCGPYPALAAALSEHQLLVGPMAEDELRGAIERPASLAGGEVEPGLVEVLLQDVSGRPGSLPLLQFALTELWRRRDGRRLTVAAYRAVGGLEGALKNRADDVLRTFDTAQRELCRRIFLSLTQPGEGTEDTKRRALFTELVSAGADPGEVESVVDRLADARLVTTGDSKDLSTRSVEVAHEALIRGWGQLRQWVDADRAGLRTRRRLTETTREWEQHGRDPDLLLTGARLATAREWSESHPGELSPSEVDFLAAGISAERQKRDDEAEKNRRLAEAERQQRQTAEASARRQAQLSRRFLAAAVVAAALAASSGGLALWANWQKQRAETETTRAQDIAKVAVARDWMARDPTKAALALSEIRYPEGTPYALALMREVATQPLTFVAYDLAGARPVCFSPNLTHALTTGVEGAQLWALDGSGKVADFSGLGVIVAVANFSPSGERLVAFSPDGIVRVWDISQPSKSTVLKGSTPDVIGGWFDLKGDRVIAVLKDRRVMVWDLDNNTEPTVSEPFKPYNEQWRLEVASFDARNNLIAATTEGTEILVWRLGDASKAIQIYRNPPGAHHLSFNKTGDRLLGIHSDEVWIWNTDGKGEPLVLEGVKDQRVRTTVANFSQDGNLVLSAANDGSAKVWKADGSGGPIVLGTEGGITAAAFSSDATRVVAASDNETAIVWYVGQSSERMVLSGHNAGLTDARISPEGDRVVTTASDGTMRIWYIGDRRDPVVLRTPIDENIISKGFDLIRERTFWEKFDVIQEAILNHMINSSDGRLELAQRAVIGGYAAIIGREYGPPTSAALSPRGDRLAVTFEDGTLVVWKMAGTVASNPSVLGEHEGLVSIAWSGTGDRVATGSRFGGVRVWRIDKSKIINLINNEPIGGMKSSTARHAPSSGNKKRGATSPPCWSGSSATP